MEENIKVTIFSGCKNKELYHTHLALEQVEKCKETDKDNKIFLNKCIELTNYPFKEYQKCGTKLDVNYGIDFTISNGNYKKGEASLHSPNLASNIYTKVLIEIGQMLAKYQKEGQINSLMGFGAK